MVLDSSALIAILTGESSAGILVRTIAADPKRLMSAMTALEAAVVIERKKGPAAGRELDLLVHRTGIEVVPFNAEQVVIARAAYHRFGKGRHPAALNLGDCSSYALAMFSGEPLLFVGDDFSKTDIRSALS